jgi:hypothetical protein
LCFSPILVLVPVVFCLCEHKNYETYQLIIQVLKTAMENLTLDWDPQYWMSDYESGLTKAIKEEVIYKRSRIVFSLSQIPIFCRHIVSFILTKPFEDQSCRQTHSGRV